MDKSYNIKLGQNMEISKKVHKLPTQLKLILLSVLLQEKYDKANNLSKKISVCEINEICIELCSKTGESCINKRKIKNCISTLINLELIKKENIAR